MTLFVESQSSTCSPPLSSPNLLLLSFLPCLHLCLCWFVLEIRSSSILGVYIVLIVVFTVVVGLGATVASFGWLLL